MRYGLRLVIILPALLAFFLTDAAEAAFRLHFRNGNMVEVSDYEDRGDSIVYQRLGGIISVPKNTLLKIEDLGPPSARSEPERARSRSAVLFEKFSADLESLITRFETEGDVLTVTVADVWYSLRDFQRERITEYLKLVWANESLKHGYPKGIYLVKIKDIAGKILVRAGETRW